MSDSKVEREFGVAFPGTILDSSKWTQTALKAMPTEGKLDWKALFGREAPVVLDLGCGNGRYLIGSALLRPGHDHFGVDILPVVIRYARKRGNQRGLKNLKIAVLGGHELLQKYVPEGSVDEIHIYHPQPYADPAEVHKRLITPTFLTLVHQALKPGGLIVLQTDSADYWKQIQTVIDPFFEFHQRIGRWPDAPKGRTRREIMAIKKKLPIFRGSGTARPGLSYEDAIRIAENL
jgi:tRNA (guanine-N7-)-methyltransferase